MGQGGLSVIAIEVNHPNLAGKSPIVCPEHATSTSLELTVAGYVKRQLVELTDAGRVFVEEARSTRSHIGRAVDLGCVAHLGADGALWLGTHPLLIKNCQPSG